MEKKRWIICSGNSLPVLLVVHLPDGIVLDQLVQKPTLHRLRLLVQIIMVVVKIYGHLNCVWPVLLAHTLLMEQDVFSALLEVHV